MTTEERNEQYRKIAEHILQSSDKVDEIVYLLQGFYDNAEDCIMLDWGFVLKGEE